MVQRAGRRVFMSFFNLEPSCPEPIGFTALHITILIVTCVTGVRYGYPYIAFTRGLRHTRRAGEARGVDAPRTTLDGPGATKRKVGSVEA